MAVRRWRVSPDVQVPINGEWVDMVSREALVQGVLDGVAMLDRSGGVLTVIVGRQPTELEGEMVTTGAIVEWKNRTDAAPQPEQSSSVPVHGAGLFASTEPTPEQEIAEQLAGETEIVVEPATAPAEESPDGLDYSTLPDEDLSDIPVHAR